MFQAFDDLKIRTRLAVMVAGVLLMLCAVAGSGAWATQSLFEIARDALDQDVALARQATDVRTLVLQERRFEKDAFINLADAAKRDEYVKKWRGARQSLDKEIADTRALKLLPEDAKALDDIARSLAAYDGGFQATIARIADGTITTTQDANTQLAKVKAAVHAMEEASDAMAERASARAATVPSRIADVRASGLKQAVLLALAGIVAAVGMCVLVARSITGPIAQAVQIAETVAAGDLTTRVASRRRDETGQLLRALQRMSENLVKIVGQVREASGSIATGSSQIATGNADLSQRTEEQASNLQQTAASMEEITATVRQNADTAREASALAGETATLAERGGAAFTEVVGTMGDISDSSRRIGDIIGVIDGIAFQTNILALNAAVEAARAGEQGRGFAVVAGEVRLLAQRSAQAAKEIKGLIGESVEKVSTGTRHVDAAGRTMQEIVDQVKRVDVLLGEISSACQEQSTGVGQVGDAVGQLDLVTQQNAALVEESAAAAESLRLQAAQLEQVVAQFRLQGA